MTFGLAYVANAMRLGYKLTHGMRARVTEEERQRARGAFDTLHEIEFDGVNDTRLRGWYAPPSNGTVLIYVPGLGGNRASLLPEAALLARNGYGAVLFDPRGHGESDGETSTWGDLEAEDTRRAVRFIRTHPEVERVVLLGFSVGASTVVLAAADNSEVDAVISYACWTSLHEELRDKLRGYGPPAATFAGWSFALAGGSVPAVRPIDRVAHIAPRPLLLITGTEDKDTPVPIMQRMFEAARQPKQLWVVPGSGHGGYLEAAPAEYEARVLSFLRDAFPRQEHVHAL